MASNIELDVQSTCEGTMKGIFFNFFFPKKIIVFRTRKDFKSFTHDLLGYGIDDHFFTTPHHRGDSDLNIELVF